MARRLSSFQTLALWTTAATYFLIFVGGLVRASGAGLGCPDWPRCFGSWIPPASTAALPPGFDAAQFNPALMWTEYLNRVLGVTVGFLILATLVSAWRHHRRTPQIFWPTAVAFLLVGFQGWLGGVVVQQELTAWIVTVHMLVALVIVSLLLYATVHAFFAGSGRTVTARGRRPLLWTLAVLIVVTLLQVTLGTQVRERIDAALSRGVARNEALSTVGQFDIWHREAALVVIAGTVAALWLLRRQQRRQRELVRAAAVMAGLTALQIVLGATMAYATLTPPVQVLHLTGSSLLLGAQTVVLLLARWR
jgi:cytochrome c oxidase assembly protein subunit 15